MKSIYILLLSLLSIVAASATTNNSAVSYGESLQGKITDAKTGESLIGVNIYLPELKRGATTDESGKYRLENLPNIKTSIEITYVGHESIVRKIDLRSVKTIDFVLEESNARINEVVVTGFTGNSLLRQTPTAMAFVSPKELLQQTSTNIIDAIAKQPGVSQITTGSGISKPVIRGLGYNRVVVVNNGIRQEGQQWGDEHGIEIDDQTVNSVEILKGPASLMYGSDALAGVINFLPEPVLPEGKIQTNVFSEYQTNNGLIHYSVNNAGNKNNYIWNVRYSDKWAHAYKNNYDGYVYNSGYQEHAFSGLFGINRNWGYSHIDLSLYHLTPGIVEGDRDETTGKFIKPVLVDGEEGEAIATNSDFKSYKHQMPYQQIYHFKAVSDNNILLGQGNLRAIVGYQQNRRQEFEDIVNPDEYGLYFQLHTLSYDFRYSFPELNGYKIVTGVNGMYQHSMNKGSEFLIPEYNLFDAGVFAMASRQIGQLNLSGGLRFDSRRNHGHSLVTTDEESGSDVPFERFADFKRNFYGFSGSIGAAYRISDAWSTKLNFSRGFRAPNMSELASNGAHEGTLRYEIGDIHLKAENSWQADWGLSYSSKLISGNVSLFANRINNYIFAHKLTDAQGNEVITDEKMTYQYSSGDARIWGGEISVDIHPVERLHFENTFSYVNSTQLNQPDSTKYLPMTPAPRFTSDLRYDLIRHGKTWNNTYISVGVETNLKQNHVYSAYGTETETPSYTLLNAAFGTDLIHNGRRVASFFLTGNNLTDKAYQNHLSRLKYGATNEVTGRQGVFNMGRSFGVKVQIPVNF
jgi:iron complex outermembrane receptor protein